VLDGRTLRCATHHAFDVAREGYVSLLAGSGSVSTGDTPQMVRARRDFLGTGHYSLIADAVVQAVGHVDAEVPGVFLDAGGGTGEYLRALLDAFPTRYGIVLDGSKHAARSAARAHPRMAAVVADVWKRLPLRDVSCALVTSIFAPRNAEEFARVLGPGGALVVVVPGGDHLHEISRTLGMLAIDPEKRERLDTKLGTVFRLEAEKNVRYTAELTREEAVLAALMGPTAAHASLAQIEGRATALPAVISTTVSAEVLTYRRATAT